MQSEDRVHEGPGQQDRADAEHNPVSLRRAAEFDQDRGEARQRRRRRQHQNRDRALIVDGGPPADIGDRRVRGGTISEREIERDAAVPADEDAGRHRPGHGQ